MRYCICADPENCKETIPGYVCRKGMQPLTDHQAPQADCSTLSKDDSEHSLTLHFQRVLSEAEWRDVVGLARQLPYVQHLEAVAAPRRDTGEKMKSEAPSLPAVEALQQLVAKWRHVESVDETGLPHGVIWASDCADDLEKLLGEAVLETIAPPQKPSESQLNQWLSAMETGATYDQRRDAYNDLRDFFATVVASPRGGPAKE